jgi:hypothetical protein
VLPSEPQTIGGVLDSGFNVYRRTLKSVAVPATVMGIFLAGCGLGMAYSIDFAALATIQNADPDAPSAFPHISPLFWLFWALYMVAFLMFFVVVAHRQWALITGQQASLANDIFRGFALLIPLMFASFLYYVCLVVGFILLIIPGLILMVSMSLYLFVPIVEDRGGWMSIRRSHALVWGGNWFRTAAVFTVLLGISIALTFTFQLVLGATSGFDALVQPTAPNPLATVGGALLAIILYPLITAIMLALYSDLLIRKEAGDLDSRLQALDEPSA